jgi:hypothetical protein
MRKTFADRATMRRGGRFADHSPFDVRGGYGRQIMDCCHQFSIGQSFW